MNQKNNIVDMVTERHSLEKHVDACTQRYAKVVDKLAGLEERLDRMELLLRDVHRLAQKQNSLF
jgi:phage shock protein A